jgi:NAD(P)-dependent dehydrogenase (short-subunit alcohol dehydrogenase family)
MTAELVEPVLDVHLRGAFHVTRPAWAVMRAQGYGRIVNTTSVSGLVGMPGQTNYGSAKAGVFGLTRVLAQEGAALGIKVNALAPTAATRMLLGAMHEETNADPAAIAAVKSSLDRLDPSLVAPVAAVLAHETCPVTGEVYSAGGGLVTRLFLARTVGFFSASLSPEDVRDHFDEIRDESGYTVPTSTTDAVASIFEAMGQATP